MDFQNPTTEDYEKLGEMFKSETNVMHSLFMEKNIRYEASFFKQCAEDNDLSSVPVRLADKLNRFKSLVKNPDLDNVDESVKDTLMDLANYSVMSLIYLKMRGDK